MYFEDKSDRSHVPIAVLLTAVIMLLALVYLGTVADAASVECPPGTRAVIARGVYGVVGVCSPVVD